MNGSRFKPNLQKFAFLMLNSKELTLFYLLTSTTTQIPNFLLDSLKNYLHEKVTLLKNLKIQYKLRMRSAWKA